MGDESDRLENKPTDRRGFFREGLASILGPLANLVERRLAAVQGSFQPPPPSPRLLRPPGALPEEQFLATCRSCGRCAAVCPVGAIYLVRDSDGLVDAHPVINVSNQPCVVCDPPACIQECPSGALVPTRVDRIDMGLAVVRRECCLRTTGEDCRACVDRCPLGAKAIGLEAPGGADELPPVTVRASGCVGCGSCEFYCPAEPRAIIVQPHR